jgi:multiple sugar transport system permease protein
MSGLGARQRWMMTASGCLILAVMLFPLYWMANVSFQPRAALLATKLRWLPIPPMVDNYLLVLGQQAGNILTSCIIALSTAVLSLVIAAPAAYALVVFRLRWITLFVLALLIVQMIPHVVMANALYAIFVRAGLLNTHLGLILADSTMGVPFAILILRAFMVSLPRTLVEAALVDGATHWHAFRWVILPMSRNGLITSGLFCFLFAWSDFLFALTMGTERKIVPITLGIYQYIGSENVDWNNIMATAVLASIPPVVLLLAGQRYITAGLTGGAVKE